MFNIETRLPILLLNTREKVALGVFFLGISVSIVGFYLLWQTSNQVDQVDTQQLNVASTPQTITVDIGGAVREPGLYTLNADSRLSHVIEKAGGFHDKADALYIAQILNVSSQLKDSEKIYIPFEGELDIQASTPSTHDASALISINSATATSLQTLEGIGEKRADDIIAGRPYTAINELVSKNVITQSQFEKIEKSIQL